MSGAGNLSGEGLDELRVVLDRAHVAARDANGAMLRQAMEEARDRLQNVNTAAAAQLSKALADLDSGALVEMDALLESVRRDVTPVS